MARLGWLTDIHLNFLSGARRRRFYDRLRASALDALLISGDIGEADSVQRYLAELEAALQTPIYFVLGNHDFYRGSIGELRQKVSRQAAASQYLRWLSQGGVHKLSETTALVGHDGWADGRLGHGRLSEVVLNDHILIRELSGLSKGELFRRLRALGDEAAACLGRVLEEAFQACPRVILLTHVPPFTEACWHEGRVSDPDYLPHFASQAAGEAILEALDRYPDREVTVLCGHSHSPGEATIRSNLLVSTGGAAYGKPKLQRVIVL